MTSLTMVDHKGTAIMLSDMSNTTPKQAMETAMELLKGLSKCPPKNSLLLIDLTDCQFDKQSVDSWMQIAPKVEPYVKAMAIVGACKLLSIIVSNVTTNASMPFTGFSSRLEAMDWLKSKA